MELLIAIDGGGTRTRTVVFNREGQRLAEVESGPSNHLTYNRREVRDNLQAGIVVALHKCGARAEHVRLVAAGLAGVDFDGEGRQEALAILDRAGYTNVIALGDMVTAHYGALGGEPGVLALAGTGSVTLARGMAGNWIKVDGWGYLLGDEGSAFWIGRQALSSLCKVLDGRLENGPLTLAVSERLHLRSFAEVVAFTYGSGRIPPEIPTLSILVDEAAEAGDPLAKRILQDAGEALAACTSAAARQAALGANFRVSYAGAVLRGSRTVRQAFRNALPEATVTPPAHEPVVGAYILGCRELGWEPNLP